jgi:hypothetical protein
VKVDVHGTLALKRSVDRSRNKCSVKLVPHEGGCAWDRPSSEEIGRSRNKCSVNFSSAVRGMWDPSSEERGPRGDVLRTSGLVVPHAGTNGGAGSPV